MSNSKLYSLFILLLIIQLKSIEVKARTAATSTNKIVKKIDDATSSLCGVSLDLSDMNLGPVLDKRFLISPYIEKLLLRHNNIERFGPGVFDDLPNLKFLDLSHNKLGVENMLLFGGHEALQTLILDYNKPRNYSANSRAPSFDLPGHLVYPNLKNLSLRGISIDLSFTNWSWSFPVLDKVDLSDVSLEQAQHTDFIGSIQQSVKNLILQNTNLNQLNISQLNYIEDLDLSGNNFSEVFHSSNIAEIGSYLILGSLSNLNKLNLSNCRTLRVDKDAFKNAFHMEELDLSNNQISYLDDTLFSKVFYMKKLYLSNNPSLLQLNFIQKMPSLYTLTLDSMSNPKLVETLDSLDYYLVEIQLRTLSLRNNSLTTLPLKFLNQTIYLDHVDLSDNKLSYLWPWKKFDALKKLNIRKNLFTTFDNVPIQDGKRLQEIHVGENPVKEIELKVLRLLPSTSTLNWE